MMGEERGGRRGSRSLGRHTADSLIYMQIHFHKMAAIHFAPSQRAGLESKACGSEESRLTLRTSDVNQIYWDLRTR